MARPPSSGRPGRLSPLLLFLLLTAAALAPGGVARAWQDGVGLDRVTDRRSVLPGLDVERVVEARRVGAMRVEGVLVTPGAFTGSIVWQEPESGVASLVALQRGAAGYAALGVPREAPDPLVLRDGRLFRWPVQGPLVVLEPEGGVSLTDAPAAAPLVLAADAATTVALRLGAAGGGDSALLTRLPGPDELRGMVLRGTAVVLRTDSGVAASRVVWDPGVAGSGLFRTAGVYREGTLADNQALLVLKGEDGARVAAVLAAEEGTSVSLRVSLPEALATASAVLAGGRVLARDGAVAAGLSGPPAAARNGLAIGRGGEVALYSAPVERRGDAGATMAEAAALMVSRGFMDVVELGTGEALMTVEDGSLLDISTRRGDRLCRGAIVVSARRTAATTAAGAMERVRIASVGLGLGQVAAHGPMLLNGGGGEGMVWAARVPGATGDGRSLELILARNARLAAIDLVHAERAGFSPEFNLRSANVYTRASAAEPWVLAGEVRNAAPVARQRIVLAPARKASQVRIEVLEPSFMPGGDVVRLAQLIPWAEPESDGR